MQSTIRAFAAVTLVSILSACVSTPNPKLPPKPISQGPQSADDGWVVSTPKNAKFDSGALEDLSKSIRSGSYGNIHAVLVEKSGALVYEQYFKGEDAIYSRSLGVVDFGPHNLHDLRSVTKSVTTLLLGIALGDNFDAALKQPIIAHFPRLSGKTSDGIEKITLHHVLTMTAGLEWDEVDIPYTNPLNDERRMSDASDPVAMVLGRPIVSQPGSQWEYSGGLTQVVAGLIEEITGMGIDKYAEEKLFGPLGINDYFWQRPRAWTQGRSPSAASGLRLRARDLAKIGSLVLADGVWNGRQIVPKRWIEQSKRRFVQRTWGPNFGYGYMWYPSSHMGANAYGAIGNGQQRLFIVPEQKLVVTMLAGMYNQAALNETDGIIRSVLQAQY